MKMSLKLILLFSVVAVITTVTNSVLFLSAEMKDLNEHTADNLTAIGNKMIAEVEQNIMMMDYALEEMASNTDFMNALYTVWTLGSEQDDLSAYLQSQNTISSFLYHEPLNENFFRVSVWTDEGFFLSSHFDKNDTIDSYSEDMKTRLKELDWLSGAAYSLQRRIVTPHEDPWTTSRPVTVYTALRPAIWRGRHIGYLEAAATEDELAGIFSASSIEGFSAQAVFDDGRILYRGKDDPADYSSLRGDGMTECRAPDGSERLVVPLRSKWLGLSVYVAQNLSAHRSSVRSLISYYVMLAGFILLGTVFIIILLSLGLTKSIRDLTQKMRRLDADNLLSPRTENGLFKRVTKRGDHEMRELENVFDDLLVRLTASLKNEMSMRECTLTAQLNALQAQINPHFVYNTLNIISAKSMECGNEEIIAICDQFAQMLRYSTDLSGKTVTLAEEIRHVRNYLLLAKARYEDDLQYVIDVPDEIQRLTLPKLSLQPIVENALTHGRVGAGRGRMISISGCIESGMLRLVIHDNGDGFAPDVLERLKAGFTAIESGAMVAGENTDGHIGLINTYQRLFYFSHGAMRMKLYNDNGAVVELNVPGQATEEANV